MQALRPAEVFGLLASIRDRCDHLVRLRCGKCSAILDEIHGDPANGRVEGKGATLAPVPGTMSAWTPPAVPRPRVDKKASTSPEAVQERYTYTCPRKRCGCSYPVRVDTLVVAYVRAARAGVTEIRLPISWP